MSKKTRAEIASMGGKAAHAKGTAHTYTSDEAKVAGRKGGLKVSENREYMREIGRRGGLKVSADTDHMKEIARQGGLKTSENKDHMREIGRKGGRANSSEHV